jgi:thiol-disulfide isomerase/thioredoxin
MKRRNMLYGGAAAVAGLAGAGVAWWRADLQSQDALADKEAAESFWRLSFETPDGQALAMSRFRGQKVLLNFWATWCPPCIEELPLLDNFHQQHKADNSLVLGLAVDQPSAVRAWLAARPLHFPVGMAGLGGTALSKSLGNESGSLPFSVAFGASGRIVWRKVGKLSQGELDAWARSAS